MEKHIFEAVTKLESILNKLPEDHELYSNLADIESQILQIDKYTDDDKIVNRQTRTLNYTHGNLKSYSQVYVLYNYKNGYSLVEDTSGELYYIPTNNIE